MNIKHRTSNAEHRSGSRSGPFDVGCSTFRVRRSHLLLLPLLLLLILPGCTEESGEAKPLDPVHIFGSTGESFGQFTYPRAIDVDPARGVIYIIDRSGRIQSFSPEGRPLESWNLPPSPEPGYPTGLTVAPDGRLFIADTHRFCVTVLDPETGEMIEQIGELGEGPGQFNNPTDIAFGPDGWFYVSEFGGNDRIQVFDAEGAYLFEFGGFGSEPGRFNRPQSMAFSPDFQRLYVCDACNHRVQVFDPEGNLIEIWGGPGTKPGEFRYPYGVKLLGEGSVLISEFGNNRLQILSDEGEPIRIMGAAGREPGELYSPWDAAPFDGRIFVLDSRNDRVQVITE